MKKTKKETIKEGIDPKAFPTEATSKAVLMANVMDAMGKMSQMDMTHLFNSAQELIGKEADSIPDGTADRNLASINSQKAVNEELLEILTTETLSEETKEKASVLFEAAVNTKVSLKTAELEEQFEAKMDEELELITEELINKIDEYMTYVAEHWVKENKVSVDNSIRTQLAEDLISGLHTLFKEHYVTIPDEQVDAVEALSEEIKSLREQLNVQVNENIDYKKKIEQFRKDEIIKEISEGLAATQIEKLRQLAEGLDFGNEETFKKKLTILREGNFVPKNKSTKILTENEEKPEKKTLSGLDRLAEFIENSTKI